MILQGMVLLQTFISALVCVTQHGCLQDPVSSDSLVWRSTDEPKGIKTQGDRVYHMCPGELIGEHNKARFEGVAALLRGVAIEEMPFWETVLVNHGWKGLQALVAAKYSR